MLPLFAHETSAPLEITNVTSTNMWATSGVEGQVVYNTTYRQHFRWVTDRWVIFGQPDKRYGIYVEDDWASPAAASQFGWLGLGTTALDGIALANVLGVITIRQASAGARSMLTSSASTVPLGASDAWFEALIYIPTLATAGEDFVASLGFYDQTSYDANGAATDGVYFSYNRANNGANWNCVTASNGVLSTTQTSTPIVANTLYRLSILINGTTSAKFYVNGALVATNLTLIPSGVARATGVGFKIDKTLGSANSELCVDATNWWLMFNSARAA